MPEHWKFKEESLATMKEDLMTTGYTSERVFSMHH